MDCHKYDREVHDTRIKQNKAEEQARVQEKHDKLFEKVENDKQMLMNHSDAQSREKQLMQEKRNLKNSDLQQLKEQQKRVNDRKLQQI